MNAPARGRVLLVEDRASVRQVLATIMESGFEVTACAGGAAALAHLGRQAFDVVVTDVRMPGTSGLELLGEVRRRAPDTRVVVMTAYANGPDAMTALRLGASDYLSKPVDADDLVLAVARAAERAPPTPWTPPAEVDAGGAGFRAVADAAREDASRAYLAALVARAGGDLAAAGERVGLSPEALDRLLVRYGVERVAAG